MKKALAIALCAFVCLCVGCNPAVASSLPEVSEPVSEQTTQIPNPLVSLPGPEGFTEALGWAIYPPDNATDASYTLIGQTLAQVGFTLDGRVYSYRCSATDDDITGVYETFDEPVKMMLDLIDIGFELTVKTIDGGQKGAVGLWTLDDGRQYSLYTADAVDADTVSSVVSALYPAAR